jgi:Cu2+-exporting ATPase
MIGGRNESGNMQVFLADESGWLAGFELNEVVRPDAAEAVKQLQAAGLDVHMLSGDRIASARRVAERLGITLVQGDCTPQSKLAHLQALQGRGHKVLMVGDGLNDGPVLARADVSVAVGQAVPLAQAQSDFIIPGGQLLMLAHMPAQAQRTLTIVRQNLVWAAAYNAVCVPLAISGSLPAWLAGLGMALSSLFVMLNAARLSRTSQAV